MARECRTDFRYSNRAKLGVTAKERPDKALQASRASASPFGVVVLVADLFPLRSPGGSRGVERQLRRQQRGRQPDDAAYFS